MIIKPSVGKPPEGRPFAQTNDLYGEKEFSDWQHAQEIQVGCGWREEVVAATGMTRIEKLVAIINTANKSALIFSAQAIHRIKRAIRAGFKLESEITAYGGIQILDTILTTPRASSLFGVRDKIVVGKQRRTGLTVEGVYYVDWQIVLTDIDHVTMQFSYAKAEELLKLLTACEHFKREGKPADNRPWILGTIKGYDRLGHSSTH